jgi:hypothetical protein
MVCSNAQYVEVIIGSQITPDILEEIRVSEPEYAYLWEIAFFAFKRKLTPGERALAHDFTAILQWLKGTTLSLREMNDA